MIIHAPSANFVIEKIMSTMNDSTAPAALIARPTFQRGSFLRMWCLAMPDCESVKPRNTPMA